MVREPTSSPLVAKAVAMTLEMRFLQFKTAEPDLHQRLVIAEDNAQQWQQAFSIVKHWEANRSFDQKSRLVLSRLAPPFFPEDEILIFDPGVSPNTHTSIVHIKRVTSSRLTLSMGFFFATASRLVWGNRLQGTVGQVHYGELAKIERGAETYTLHLMAGETVTLTLHTPVPAESSSGRASATSLPLDDSRRQSVDLIGYFEDFFRLLCAASSGHRSV